MQEFESGFAWYFSLWHVAYIASSLVLLYAVVCVVSERTLSNVVENKQDRVYILRCPPINPEGVYLLVLSLVLLIHVPAYPVTNRLFHLMWITLTLFFCVLQCHEWNEELYRPIDRLLMRLVVQNGVSFLLFMVIVSFTSNTISLIIDPFNHMETFILMFSNVIGATTLIAMVMDLVFNDPRTHLTISPYLGSMIILIHTAFKNWVSVIFLIINGGLLIWKVGKKRTPHYVSEDCAESDLIKNTMVDKMVLTKLQFSI